MEKEHAFKIFNTCLKQDDFKDLIFIYGEEDYLRDWAYQAIITKYIKKETIDMDLVKLDSDCSIDDIIEACETISMFSSKRVVIVKDFPYFNAQKFKGYSEEKINELLEYLENDLDGVFLIFVSTEVDLKLSFVKNILKISKSFYFEKLDLNTLIGFSLKKFKELGFEPSKDIIKYLIDETGYFNKESEYKLYNLINDIVKICSYEDKDNITKESIDKVLVGELDSYIFNFFDAISDNKKNVAFRMLHTILEEEDIFKLLGALISNFEFILSVAELKDQGTSIGGMKSRLNQNGDFRIKKALKVANKYSVKELKKALSKFYEVDRNIKNGSLDGVLNLEMILSEL